MFFLFLFVFQMMGFSGGFAEERHTVKTGDSLYKISKAHGVSVDALKAANHLERENLKLNQVLLIPNKKGKQAGETVKKSSSGGSSYVVKKGDTLQGISKRVGLSSDEIKRINQLRTNNLKAGQTLLLSIPREAAPREAAGDLEEELGDAEEAGAVFPEEGEEAKPAIAEPGSTEPVPVEPASGRWKNPEERNLFIRVVKTFMGVPYRLGGSSLKGIDCSAFVKKIYEIFNIQLPRTTWEQLRIGKRIGKGDLEEGDLVFFKVPTRRASNRHVGIYIGNNEFVHASSRNREVRVDSLEAPYFSKRFINGVRVRELERDL